MKALIFQSYVLSIVLVLHSCLYFDSTPPSLFCQCMKRSSWGLVPGDHREQEQISDFPQTHCLCLGSTTACEMWNHRTDWEVSRGKTNLHMAYQIYNLQQAFSKSAMLCNSILVFHAIESDTVSYDSLFSTFLSGCGKNSKNIKGTANLMPIFTIGEFLRLLI